MKESVFNEKLFQQTLFDVRRCFFKEKKKKVKWNFFSKKFFLLSSIFVVNEIVENPAETKKRMLRSLFSHFP